VDVGWNRLVGTQPDRIVVAVRDFAPPIDHPAVLGDGCAAEHIVEVLERERVEVGGNYGRVALPLASLPVAL
jgi:UDP-N-acetylglucosamine 2-epimerase (non-hydrolysing)/UDP-GlcNAc3NAcA epimerase